jgi:hypothetical protein
MEYNPLRIVAAAAVSVLPRRMRLSLMYRLLNQTISESDLGRLHALFSHVDPQILRLEDRMRQLETPTGQVEGFVASPDCPALERSIMQPNRPWKGVAYPRFDIPGMITDEEIQYYHWLARYYSGDHEVVELGPWLGHSTMHLASALGSTLRRSGKRIHVYDDFVWRPGWMNQHLRPHDPAAPQAHESFEHLFNHFTAGAADLLRVRRGKITDYDGNEELPPIQWNDGLIELLVVDCGRTIKANQAWFDLFSPSFIPNRSLIVMQDWRLHRERPRKSFNQTLLFTQENPRLELVHEIIDGGIATFLYR